MNWIARGVAGALDPSCAQTALARIAQVWPADFPNLERLLAEFPAGAGAIPDLLSVSPASTAKIIRDPAALLWLSQPGICASSRGPRRMRHDLGQERPPGFDPQFRALRRVKNRELLRIALRDLAQLSTLEQITYEITCVAELCLREVCDGWLAELARRWGRPATDFCVIGMGKLGGQELNYSSDIDVIFLYGEDGVLNPNFTCQEFFTRLAEKITSTFAAPSPDGPLFRIDIRLRPEGASGPLVRSMASTENYYAGFGETWERMALIKARGVTGSEELSYEFSQRLQPFIYPRSLSPDALDEIAAIKRRIERRIERDGAGGPAGAGDPVLTRNIKLGRGGIREIEFIAQAFQLIHGARNAFLQERNTLKVLRALRELNFVKVAEMEALSAAYRFLRQVEHRLQIANEAQTHTLPGPGPERLMLARSLGFMDEAAFDAALLAHTTGVRAVFEKFLHTEADHPAAARDIRFFVDPAAAEKELGELGRPGATGHVSPRTRKLYATLEPLLLANLRRLADPDAALHGFVRFVDRYGIRGLLFETLITNPLLLDMLLRLFDASRCLTHILLRRPQLLEETTRTGILGRSLDVPAHLAGLAHREEDRLPPGDWVRVYRSAQILRIALRDILGFAGLAQIHAEYSALAEACLIHMQGVLGLGETLTIVAMGKLGGEELSYGCDLDVVFIGDQPGRAADLIKAMTAQTSEGSVFPVDARLRPEGESGLLAVPLESYRQYFQSRAQLWEAQALTKARPIAGPGQQAFATWARETWAEFGRRDDVLGRIRQMHHRVVRERSGREALLAFKTGVGGLMELEFHIQALQMRHALWEPNTLRALSALAGARIIPAGDATDRAGDWLFLRKCEAAVRRMDNSGAATLPSDLPEQRHLALRMGFPSSEAFLSRCQAAREAIHAWCSALN